MTGVTEVSFSMVYATTMIVALGGNTLLIYLVWKKPETRNLTSFLFVNMAVADLLIAVFQMPISIAMFYFISSPASFITRRSCRLLPPFSVSLLWHLIDTLLLCILSEAAFGSGSQGSLHHLFGSHSWP